jgi:hypothetical protein
VANALSLLIQWHMKQMEYGRRFSWSALIALFAGTCTVGTPEAAVAAPSCDSVLPIALIQATYPGKAVSPLRSVPVGGALLVNCAYRVKGAGTISLKLFGSSLESNYGTTVNQMRAEGYKCVAVDSTLGFPASTCELAGSAINISSVVFTTTNGKYSAMLTGALLPGGPPAMLLYAVAKSVNSNIVSH